MKRFLLSLTTCAVLGACGGGGDSDPVPAPVPSSPLAKTLAVAVSETTGTNCPYGGSKVSAGVDTNGNGVLDNSEVSSVQYVCNGAPGAQGAQGLTTLVQMTAELAGANCPAGGTKVSVGVDTNSDGALAAAEVTSTGYVCNGANGSNGSNGTNGTNGSNGTNGADGVPSLIAIVNEPAGANCIHGGMRFTSGLDTNTNGVLDAAEVLATTFSCNPPPSSGLIWLDAPTATTAIPNRGYLASGSSRVVITLPATPAIGDIISVSGIGTGGWTIAQNPGQFVHVRGLPIRFTQRNGPKAWIGVASSADGTRLLAAETLGNLYTSDDAGLTWTAREPVRGWAYVASSADGSS